ncbi:MAG: hypothetical protein GTN68_04650 [Candidatus Aminicenantes bacterium]|nr:hypothetical protein [Candidatus Aminicenantes bacterium]NIQ65779.1 hypothetical protein [Candidatus Aminicenantes bacterium]
MKIEIEVLGCGLGENLPQSTFIFQLQLSKTPKNFVEHYYNKFLALVNKGKLVTPAAKKN